LAKVDTDAQAQAVTTLLGGLSLKRKQELIDKNDRLRMQFMHTQKMAAAKAREPQINTFLSALVANDKKVREVIFNAWVKDNATALGEIPDFPERFKRDSKVGEEEGDLEADTKEAAAVVKKWIKAADADVVGVYARLGPYELPSKVLTAAKKPKSKETPAADAEGDEAAPSAEAGVVGAVNEAAIAELRREMEEQQAKYEAKLAKQEDDLNKFKRLLEENKEKRKSEVAEAQEKSRAELTTKQAEWSRTEAQLRKEIVDLQKIRHEASEKVGKARDEVAPLRTQLERAEKEARRAQGKYQETVEEMNRLEEEKNKLRDRVKGLEAIQGQIANLEKQLQRYEKKGATVALASSDNLKIWEEALNEQEVKEAFKRTFNLDNIAVSHFEHDENDLQSVWKALIEQETELVNRFFALPFNELTQPTDDFRELVTSFIEIKDSLVAREQLAHMLNFVGNRFLQGFKQKV
jgi:hypothetical protein